MRVRTVQIRLVHSLDIEIQRIQWTVPLIESASPIAPVDEHTESILPGSCECFHACWACMQLGNERSQNDLQLRGNWYGDGVSVLQGGHLKASGFI